MTTMNRNYCLYSESYESSLQSKSEWMFNFMRSFKDRQMRENVVLAKNRIVQRLDQKLIDKHVCVPLTLDDKASGFSLPENMQSWLNWYSIGSDAKLVPIGEKPTFLTDIWVRIPGSALQIRGVIGCVASGGGRATHSDDAKRGRSSLKTCTSGEVGRRT